MINIENFSKISLNICFLELLEEFPRDSQMISNQQRLTSNRCSSQYSFVLWFLTIFAGADWSQPLQVVKPEKYILTDECRKRENWQMVICDNFYGKVCTGVQDYNHSLC